jgi:hypothetical protein
MTARLYPEELAVPPDRSAPAPASRPSGERKHGTTGLLRNRLFLLIFGYQFLSAAVTQLLDFLVWERAAARYPDPADLAKFLGIFGAVINIVSVAFVALVAGRLLTRYGVRLGLAANPAGVLVLLVTGAIVGYGAGAASTVFFLVVCASQVTDISLTDGMTRTSINATYQALAPVQRLAAQTRAEGAGVPLALGLVGVLLIVADALEVGVVTIVVGTAVLTIVWLFLGLAAFGSYGSNLRRTLTRRAWDPLALRLGPESRAAVDRLVAGDDLRDLRVGLDVLADTDDPTLAARVTKLLGDGDPARRLAAVSAATRAARTSLDAAWVVPALAPALHDTNEDVRTAAEIASATASGAADRSHARRRWVLALASDDPVRTRAAVAAAAADPAPDFTSALVALAQAATPVPGLAEALSANADSLVQTVDAALSGTAPLSMPALRRIAGALGESRSSTARAVLLNHLDHPDRDIADVVLDALAAGGTVSGRDRRRLSPAVQREAERSAQFLDVLATLDGSPSTELLARGLRDEVARSRRRAVLLLGLLHDRTAVVRTISALNPGAADRPLALETLEVTVGRGGFQAALALVDPSLGESERRDALLASSRTAASAEAVPTTASVLLADIIRDPAPDWVDPWLRACALHALAHTDPPLAREAAQGLQSSPEAITAETAAWVIRTTHTTSAVTVAPTDGRW